MNSLSRDELARRNDKVRRSWAKQASFYDRSIGFFERRLVGTSHRPWACSRATGQVLEVAVGTGLNLAHYPEGVSLTGLDLTPEMLEIARQRAREIGRDVTLKEGDAHSLPFADGSFDTVVCTYSLCGIPDPNRALSEMKRVLRPGGKLVLVDHIVSTSRVVLGVQKFIELFSIPLGGEHMTRRPLQNAAAVGFNIVERQRLAFAGIVERGVSLKPQ